MEKFKNITHYHNFLSEKLNSIEEFFTQFLIDFLNEIPEDENIRLKFEVFDSGYMDVSQSFEINNSKWEGVEVEITLRYIDAIESSSFLDFCNIRIIILKQNWWEITDNEDNIHYKFGDFPTDLLPTKIISMFEPAFSMPAEFEKLSSLHKYLDALRNAKDFVEDKTEIWKMMSEAESKIIELKAITKNYPIEKYLK